MTKRTITAFIGSAMTLINGPVSLGHGNLLDTGFAPVAGYPTQLYYQPEGRFIISISNSPLFMVVPRLDDHACYSVSVAFQAGARPSVAAISKAVQDCVREMALPFPDQDNYIVAIQEDYDVEPFDPVADYVMTRVWVAVPMEHQYIAMGMDALRLMLAKWDAKEAAKEGVHHIGGASLDAATKH